MKPQTKKEIQATCDRAVTLLNLWARIDLAIARNETIQIIGAMGVHKIKLDYLDNAAGGIVKTTHIHATDGVTSIDVVPFAEFESGYRVIAASYGPRADDGSESSDHFKALRAANNQLSQNLQNSGCIV